MQDIASCTAASNVLRHELRHILLVSLFVITSLSSDWLFVIIITKEMLCIMWNSKHFWLQVNRTSSAYNLYRRNSMEDFEKSLKYVYLRIILWVPLFLEFFASHSICTTVAWVTSRWVKFVDEVGSTIFYWNSACIFATVRTITKAHLPFNFTIIRCRMSIIQPTWQVYTTSVCWHTRCWHFCSGSSHQTIPSLRELAVKQLWTVRCYVNYLSTGITQVFFDDNNDRL